MPGPGDRADISYQVASKQELEVIYEGAGRGRGRTKLYLGAGLVVLVVVLGAGVAVWAGLLGGGDTDSGVTGDSSQQVRGTHVTTRHSTSLETTTTVQTTTSTSTSTTLKREYKLKS